jgi:hypothetical protein
MNSKNAKRGPRNNLRNGSAVVPKYQVRKRPQGTFFNIVNVRPENQARFSVVGQAVDIAAAFSFADALNRQDERLAAVNTK